MTTTPLDQYLGLITSPLDLSIDYCNTQINSDTIEPYYVVLAQYYRYVALLKAEKFHFIAVHGRNKKLPKKAFTAIKFKEFYLMIDGTVRNGIILYKNPMEHLCVLRNL